MLKYFAFLSLFLCAYAVSSCSSGNVSNLVRLQAERDSVAAANRYHKSTGFVNDFENIFTKEEIEQLTALIVDFEKRTTAQIAIVTLNDQFTDPEKFDGYALGLANYWGVGVKGKDNGVMIAISSQFRRMRIQNGLGISKILSDAETKALIDDYFIPKYKEHAYFEGTLEGLQALIKVLETKKLP